ncbi:MAG: DNA repair protein RecO [Candidatus Omnitrophica bacterium]|jgi:DNA repair protein RecO (recombination protein O)|nr:DNA repair protein RecO [Candidatus Omnitrophota bacterium]MDD5078992.1 DNA repair protein RecO [Candidatus Omnitrophota bacterium]
MAILKTAAIVLKKYDLRETSLLVNFFTRDYGKISGELKGIRKDPRKFASSLESFSHNEIIFYHKRNSSVHLVSQADLVDNFPGIRRGLPKIAAASLIVELIDGIMAQEDKNEEIFDLAMTALAELSGYTDPEKVMTIFKIKVLSSSGFRPHLDSCVSCLGRAPGAVKFSLGMGGLLCQKCSPKDLRARTIFRGTIATIMHIEKNDFKINLKLGMNPQIKKELNLVLNGFLNFHLGRELKSQKVINKLEA